MYVGAGLGLSRGAAKAAFTIMLVGLPFGPRILKYVGFEPKGDVVAAAMLESNSDRYLAETRLLHLLDKHYIRSAQHISVERPDVTSPLTPLHPWDFSLLVASLFMACLGVLPYIHFSVLGHTKFPALAIFFPICRVVGGLLGDKEHFCSPFPDRPSRLAPPVYKLALD
ncbi:hypothetical protein B0H13DRAFT_2563731 [Mycena leptocephala]|nr:hypothetical protein B0H13DRAFT_2563731 [Mycena leptocephala]